MPLCNVVFIKHLRRSRYHATFLRAAIRNGLVWSIPGTEVTNHESHETFEMGEAEQAHPLRAGFVSYTVRAEDDKRSGQVWRSLIGNVSSLRDVIESHFAPPSRYVGLPMWET